jgi:hypothetical protein
MSCTVQSVFAGVPRIAVSVNGVEIPHDWIAREVQHHPEPNRARAWQAAARALVVRELLLQEAGRHGLTPQPQTDGEGRRETEEEALIRGLIEREVSVPEADDDACRRYYEQNRQRFRSADLYEAAHILIAARRDQPEAYAAARERAQALLAALTRSPAASPSWQPHIRTALRPRRAGTSDNSRPLHNARVQKALLALNPGRRPARRSRPATASTSFAWSGTSPAGRCRSRRSETGSPATSPNAHSGPQSPSTWRVSRRGPTCAVSTCRPPRT